MNYNSKIFMNYLCKNLFMIQIEVNRVNGDFGFEARDAAGNIARMDTSPETGGLGFGIRPMQMLLMGLGGCSGIDIISILKKQRQPVEGFRMLLEGEREPGKEPSLWQTINLVIELRGAIDPDKAQKACDLAMEKYCSVAATLREARCKITWEMRLVS